MIKIDLDKVNFDTVYSKTLVPVVGADGSYIKALLPFGYTGAVTVESSVFVLPAGMQPTGWSVRCHFSIPAVENSDPPTSVSVSTLVSFDGMTVQVSKGWCTIRRDGSTGEKLQFLMQPDRLYDLVFTTSSDPKVSEVLVYVNGYLLGSVVGTLPLDKPVMLNAATEGVSVVYMYSVWSRVLSPAEVLMLYSLHYPVAGSEDSMEGVRDGMVCEFLPVNLHSDGTWWNTIAKDIHHNLRGLDSDRIVRRGFIESVGSWQAAGRMEGSDPDHPEWVKVHFYNHSFFGSQVCYVGLEGFSGVPEGITALSVPLVFTTRPIFGNSDSPVTSTTMLVVDAAQGQTWQSPTGVTLAVLEGVLVPASGVTGESIANYVKIVGGSKLEQTYIDDVGRSHTVEFTLDDITNVSYTFKYEVGGKVFGSYSTMMVATRADVEGPEQDVGTVVMSYYVNGVQGFTPPVTIRQEENKMTETGQTTSLSLSAQSVGGNGGMVYYKAGYGVQQVWTSGFTRGVLKSCPVTIDQQWAALSTVAAGDWEGSVVVESFLQQGTRVVTVSTLAPEGYPKRSLTITQQGLSDIKVALQVRATDNRFANLTGPERSIWFTGRIEWAGVSYTFNSDTGGPVLIPFREFHSGQEYSLGMITVPPGTKWEGITGVIGCGVQTEEVPGSGRPVIGADLVQYRMNVQLEGWNVNTSSSTSYQTKAFPLASDPRVSFPAEAKMPSPFYGAVNVSGGFVSSSGGVLVFEISKLLVGAGSGFELN